MAVEGIDISDYQTVGSFHAVQGAGIGFVVAKATQGVDNVQATFSDSMTRVRSTSMLFGAYHFLSWQSDPVAQAQHFLSVYRPQNGDLPPMLDCEAFTVGAPAATLMIARFLQTVEPHLGGAKMLLYTYYAAIQSQAFATDDFAGHPLWIAEYNSDAKPSIPQTWQTATIWQYSSSKAVPGIPGSVDADRFMGSAADLAALRLQAIA